MTSSSTANRIHELLDEGINQIGEIRIQTIDLNESFILSHVDDIDLAMSADHGGLVLHTACEDAREIATYADDGTYRFTKVQLNLRRGWVMILENDEDLRLALDYFYPACIGLFNAWRDGIIEVEPLREKLGRQTGMYRYTNTISNAGAQKIVRQVCGPANRCARKILWQIDPLTPLETSEASRYEGAPSNSSAAIPLLCREACNHFVAECRKEAQAEAKSRIPDAGN